MRGRLLLCERLAEMNAVSMCTYIYKKTKIAWLGKPGGKNRISDFDAFAPMLVGFRMVLIVGNRPASPIYRRIQKGIKVAIHVCG